MKLTKIIMLIIFGTIIFGLSCSEKGFSRFDLNLLNESAKKVDNILQSEVQRLKRFSKNEAVITGEWERIRELLLDNKNQKFEALYWYCLPDGSYYTLTKGKVEANLSDRGYFAKLKDGNTVVGYPIIGKTSGRKSFVIAVPIYKEEQVVGMVGSSVFLVDFWNFLKETLVIPDDYDFYAIAKDGTTIFDLESIDLLLNNTLEESSFSLVEAVKTIISTENGTVEYEWNKQDKTAIYTKSNLSDWRYVLSFID